MRNTDIMLLLGRQQNPTLGRQEEESTLVLTPAAEESFSLLMSEGENSGSIIRIPAIFCLSYQIFVDLLR